MKHESRLSFKPNTDLYYFDVFIADVLKNHRFEEYKANITDGLSMESQRMACRMGSRVIYKAACVPTERGPVYTSGIASFFIE